MNSYIKKCGCVLIALIVLIGIFHSFDFKSGQIYQYPDEAEIVVINRNLSDKSYTETIRHSDVYMPECFTVNRLSFILSYIFLKTVEIVFLCSFIIIFIHSKDGIKRILL